MYGTYNRFVLDDTACDESLGGAVAAVLITAAAANIRTYSAKEPLRATRFGIQVTTAINYNTPTALAVVSLFKRVTFGSDTGRVLIGRFAIPDAQAVGRTIFIDIGSADATVLAGEQLVVAVTTQGAGGGGIAGAYRPFVCFNQVAEVSGNQTNMVRVTNTAT